MIFGFRCTCLRLVRCSRQDMTCVAKGPKWQNPAGNEWGPCVHFDAISGPSWIISWCYFGPHLVLVLLGAILGASWAISGFREDMKEGQWDGKGRRANLPKFARRFGESTFFEVLGAFFDHSGIILRLSWAILGAMSRFWGPKRFQELSCEMLPLCVAQFCHARHTGRSRRPHDLSIYNNIIL